MKQQEKKRKSTERHRCRCEGNCNLVVKLPRLVCFFLRSKSHFDLFHFELKLVDVLPSSRTKDLLDTVAKRRDNGRCVEERVSN